MQIFTVDLTKQRLATLPEERRRVLLLLGHAVNEINVLQKLILMHRRGPAPHKIVDRVEAGQTLILSRVLIGKLHEAWELFKLRVQADAQLRAKYVDSQPAERRALLEKLNEHFGNKSALVAIRNQLSFHYTDKTNLVEENFQHLSDLEPWEFYLADTVGNSFYYASELVTTASMVRLATPDTSGQLEDFGRLLNLVREVVRDITELFQQLVTDMVDPMDVVAIGEEIGAAAKVSVSPLPFFLDEDDLRQLSASRGASRAV